MIWDDDRYDRVKKRTEKRGYARGWCGRLAGGALVINDAIYNRSFRAVEVVLENPLSDSDWPTGCVPGTQNRPGVAQRCRGDPVESAVC